MQGLNDYCFESEIEVQMAHAVKCTMGYLADCVLFVGVSILLFPVLCGFSIYLLTLPADTKGGKRKTDVWELLMLTGCHGWLSPTDYNCFLRGARKTNLKST